MSSIKKKSTVLTNSDAKVFRAISDFVLDLFENNKSVETPLKIFALLVQRMQLSPEDEVYSSSRQRKFIQKQINIFSNFCKKNEEIILNSSQNYKEIPTFKLQRIEYSSRVYINIQEILENFINNKEFDEVLCLWKHLLNIMARVNKNTKAKELLKKMQENNKDEEEEDTGFDLGSLLGGGGRWRWWSRRSRWFNKQDNG